MRFTRVDVNQSLHNTLKRAGKKSIRLAENELASIVYYDNKLNVFQVF